MDGGSVAGHTVNNATSGRDASNRPQQAALFEFRDLRDRPEFDRVLPVRESQHTTQVAKGRADSLTPVVRRSLVREINTEMTANSASAEAYGKWLDEKRGREGKNLPSRKVKPQNRGSIEDKIMWLQERGQYDSFLARAERSSSPASSPAGGVLPPVPAGVQRGGGVFPPLPPPPPR